MKTLEDQLCNYAAYHRDRRNIATHFAGVPLIVLALTTLLSRPSFEILTGYAPVSLALLAVVITSIYYLLLDIRLGSLMTGLLLLSLGFGSWAAAQPTNVWLAWGIGSFVVGWIFQFVGHAWEGRKPAFVDDIMGLLIGPLFVVAELIFLLGLCQPLKASIEARAGKIRSSSRLLTKP